MRTLKAVVLNPGRFLRRYLIMFIDIWGCHNGDWGGCGGRWMLLPSSGQRSGMLPNALQCAGQLPPQRIIWPPKSIATPLKTLV